MSDFAARHGIALDAPAFADAWRSRYEPSMVHRSRANAAWERLDPWPDSVEDLRLLGEQVVVGPLSNANLALLLHMARRARLPWTVIIGSDATRAISPIAAPTVWPPRCSGSIPAR